MSVYFEAYFCEVCGFVCVCVCACIWCVCRTVLRRTRDISVKIFLFYESMQKNEYNYSKMIFVKILMVTYQILVFSFSLKQTICVCWPVYV